MRIAQIAPLMEAVPPRAYGGTERVVASLSEALSAKGHQVTVYANAESRVNAELVVCRERSLLTDERLTAETADHILMLDRVRQEASRFDILHFHTEFLHFPMFEDLAGKTLTTCHSRLDLVGLGAFFERYRRFPLVSISDAQRRPLPSANWVATIPHGFARDLFPSPLRRPCREGGGYLVFLGRIAADKGIDTAIEIARRGDARLRIAARINTFDRPYWEQAIAPMVDGHRIRYLGEIGDVEKAALLGGADAILFPIRWPEPFGLVMIEAMACGTPVIAFPCGAVPEVVEDGVTGRIVADIDEAVRAVPEVARLDRGNIRRRFEERFSASRMADDYIALYQRLRGSAAGIRPSEAVLRRYAVRPARNGRALRRDLLPGKGKATPPTLPEDRE